MQAFARVTTILGLSAFYHDSAAALLIDGRLVAAAQEERFSRRKHDPSFPRGAVAWCLGEAGITMDRVDRVGFYERPIAKFDRLLETHLAMAPGHARGFRTMVGPWLSWKLRMAKRIRRELGLPRHFPIDFCDHHRVHARSALAASPFGRAAIVTVDAVGEWATTTISSGDGDRIATRCRIDFPHSLGLLYSAITAFAGFRVNDGEYKLMGLAPYGRPRYRELFLERLLTVADDGSFRLHPHAFDFASGESMLHADFSRWVGAPARRPGDPIRDLDRDLAATVQELTETALIAIARQARRVTGESALCLAGGVALNCSATGRLLREAIFDRVWVQPAAGDAGGAIGVAYELDAGQRRGSTATTAGRGDRAEHDTGRRATGQGGGGQGGVPTTGGRGTGLEKTSVDKTSFQKTGVDKTGGWSNLLGPAFPDDVVADCLRASGLRFETLADDALCDRVAGMLASGEVVGWFQGRMEFGPRALGNRSILADPRRPEMQSVLNQKTKFRESFRPFAPVVLRDRAEDWFDMGGHVDQPFMTFVFPVREDKRDGLPAVTHVDGTARVQTVPRTADSRLSLLLQAFERRTGTPVLINTSFNVADEPIVCRPEEAIRCFLATQIDALAIGSHLVVKAGQPSLPPFPGLAGEVADETPGKGWWKRWQEATEPIRRGAESLWIGGFYFAVLVPFALALRLTEYDPLGRRSPGAKPGWVIVEDRSASGEPGYSGEIEESRVSRPPRFGLAGEFLQFLREEKKWWLAPLLLMLGILSLLVAASSSPVAPFIYTLF